MKQTRLRSALLAVLVLFLLVKSAEAASDGAFYLTSTEDRTTILVSEALPVSQQFNTTLQVPNKTASEKVYFLQVAPYDAGNAVFHQQFRFYATAGFNLTTAPLNFTFWIGCDTPTPLAKVRFLFQRVRITQGNAASTNFPVEPVWEPPAPFICQPSQPWSGKVQTHPNEPVEFLQGDSLVVHLFPQALHTSAARSLYLLVNSTAYPSGLSGPGLPTAPVPSNNQGPLNSTKRDPPPTIVESLKGTHPIVKLRLPTNTSETRTYYWQVPGDAKGRIDYDFSHQQGKIALSFRNPEGNLVSAKTFETNLNGTIDLGDLAMGRWNLTLDVTEARGTMVLQLAAEGPDVSPDSSVAPSASRDSTDSATPAEKTVQRTPAPSAGFLLVVLLLLAGVRTRVRSK